MADLQKWLPHCHLVDRKSTTRCVGPSTTSLHLSTLCCQVSPDRERTQFSPVLGKRNEGESCREAGLELELVEPDTLTRRRLRNGSERPDVVEVSYPLRYFAPNPRISLAHAVLIRSSCKSGGAVVEIETQESEAKN